MTQGDQWVKARYMSHGHQEWMIVRRGHVDGSRIVAERVREKDADEIIAAHNAQADVLTALRGLVRFAVKGEPCWCDLDEYHHVVAGRAPHSEKCQRATEIYAALECAAGGQGS